MSSLRIESVEEPLASDRSVAQDAATLAARGQVMGFLPVGTDTRVLGTDLVRALLAGLSDQGVAVRQLLRAPSRSEHSLREAVTQALEHSEHSPMPTGEWPRLADILGEELLARLLGVSASSLRRYGGGTRPTPQDVASRLHVLALIVADLAGGYNDYGIRRWFVRPRAQLDGLPPERLLGKGWDPDGADVARLRALAAGLVGSGAT